MRDILQGGHDLRALDGVGLGARQALGEIMEDHREGIEAAVFQFVCGHEFHGAFSVRFGRYGLHALDQQEAGRPAPAGPQRQRRSRMACGEQARLR